jgi:hypothetical protein
MSNLQQIEHVLTRWPISGINRKVSLALVMLPPTWRVLIGVDVDGRLAFTPIPYVAVLNSTSSCVVLGAAQTFGVGHYTQWQIHHC